MAKLLIVDDTVESCDLLGRLFRRCGHEAVCLYGGQGVVAALRAGAFGAVVLDVMMPGMDGLEVLRRIRAAGEAGVARTPVAMYTAVCDPRLRERAVAMGANAWIVKGTAFEVVRRRVEGVMGGGK